ncbi:sugar phosphate isomerase/epimerase family protein [Breznakiella homolactica]|uniref:Sugar phosphate isomerase/epimerase n=1 Tax=Breznakiella homolactica TaxID=2798577 RepID=A0A7T7XMB4_9SPIR|nr:sugar phosphate isomerase/epimerase family protein [Breznakiella homolactica]QQO08965.1 sugar phosphate isomerase/epimerase [Breznakiella homolactica]
MLISTTTGSWRDRPNKTYVPIIRSIPKFAAAGFDAVDINFCHAIHLHLYENGIEINGDSWMDWVEETKNVLAENHIAANQSHAPFYNVLDHSLTDREFREEMVRRSVIASGKLSVKWVVIHAGTIPDSPSARESLRANIEYFKPHLELAAENGTGIAIENLFDFSSDENSRGARRYTGGLDELLELVDSLARDFPNVGICWDFGHANEMALNQEQALKLVGKRLKALHVNDNNGVLDDHTLPFAGLIDWPRLMKVLKEIGYDGDFTYEIHRFTQRMPEELIDEALRFSVSVARYLVSLAQ